MRIYLDTCSLQRPLDNLNQLRIAVEAEAILGILLLFETGAIELISSQVLQFEIKRIPNLHRQNYVLEILAECPLFIRLTDDIEERAKHLNTIGIKPLDALHVASAEVAKADYFCTCDDKLLKKTKSLKDSQTKFVSPLELIAEIQSCNNQSDP